MTCSHESRWVSHSLSPNSRMTPLIQSQRIVGTVVTLEHEMHSSNTNWTNTHYVFFKSYTVHRRYGFRKTNKPSDPRVASSPTLENRRTESIRPPISGGHRMEKTLLRCDEPLRRRCHHSVILSVILC